MKVLQPFQTNVTRRSHLRRSESSATHALRTPNHKGDQTLYCPTNAHNVKNVVLLKHITIMEAAPTCFGLQRNHNQGATAST
jgi:hypothetical protein